MKITVVAFDDCMTSGVFGLLDAFGVAARMAEAGGLWRTHQICLATANGEPVHGFGGHRIQPTHSLAAAADSNVIVVPAILGDLLGTIERERTLVSWIASMSSSPTLLTSSCTGAFLLAEARALDGHLVTTNPYYSDLFQSRYPAVKLDLERRIAADRNVICAGSTSAVLDLAIFIIDRLGGHELAVRTAKALSMDKNAGSQRPYLLFVAPRDHGDGQVLQAQEWIEEHHASAIRLEDIAVRGGMSLRSLSRRFQAATRHSPVQYLRAVRIETAKRLLEIEQSAVEEIASTVGYGDVRAFTRAFTADAGVSPSQYRRRFRMRSYQG